MTRPSPPQEADWRPRVSAFPSRQLDAFRATLATGSLTRAAHALGVSQPAVTKLIAALEAEVGFALFVRARSGVTATREGLAFGEAVKRHYVGLERLAQAAQEIRDVERGHTRVAVTPALATDLMPGAIARFHARHPAVRVNIEVHTAARVVELVEAAVFDVGLTHLQAPSKDVAVLAGYEMDCVVVMPPEHPLAAKRFIEPEDLNDVAMVMLAHHTVTARHISQMLLHHNVHPVVTIDCQPSFVACALVLRNLGVAIVDPLTPSILGEDRIAVRPLVPAIPFQFKLITPAVATLARSTRALVGAMIDHIATTPDVRVVSQARVSPGTSTGAIGDSDPDLDPGGEKRAQGRVDEDRSEENAG